MISTMPRKLTPAIRATFECHKTARKKQSGIQSILEENIRTNEMGYHNIKTPEDYVKAIMIDEEIALGKFLEKIITLGSSQGFVAFMMLYQYMYDNQLLGKEIEELTGQEIIDHIYGDKSYRLKNKNKQRFLSCLIQLSGLQFYMKNFERTIEIRKKPGSEENFIFKNFTLMKVKETETLSDEKTIVAIRGVSIMKDFINLWHKKMSKLYIPLEDVLKISRDHNGDHKRGFNLAVALRHAELGCDNDTIEWDLNYCLNAGQWRPAKKEKSKAWRQIIESLEEGKKQELLDYTLIYYPNKPQKLRYIKKVAIKRLWQTTSNAISLGFKPEEIITRKKRFKSTGIFDRGVSI